jgi:p-hydroxybenzoate 3-monooxygenase
VAAATRTQVAIIGGGPAGLLLSHILHRNGIESVVLERQSRVHVLARIRASVLEAGTIALLREVGLGALMDREGHPHDGSAIAWEDRPRFFSDTNKFTAKRIPRSRRISTRRATRPAAKVIDQAENVPLKIGSSGKSAKKAPAGTGLVGAKVAIRHTRPKEHQRTGT